VTRVNYSARVTTFGGSDSTRVTLTTIVTRLKSHFSQNGSTRVTLNDSKLKSESFLQNLSASDGQSQFVCQILATATLLLVTHPLNAVSAQLFSPKILTRVSPDGDLQKKVIDVVLHLEVE